MTKQDRQKVTILGILLAVLASVVVMVLRMNEPAAGTPAPVQVPETAKISVNPPAPGDASLRKDLLEKTDTRQQIGKRNIFEYRQAPPPPPEPPRGSKAASSNPNGNGSGPGNSPPPSVQPPLPPQIPLKYVGYLTQDTPDGGSFAVLSDDSRHYSVTAGEVLMGRYRVLTISDKVVDVEDLEYKRRQSLPIVK